MTVFYFLVPHKYLVLCLEEVVADIPADYALPVFLHKHIPGTDEVKPELFQELFQSSKGPRVRQVTNFLPGFVDHEQTVNHLEEFRGGSPSPRTAQTNLKSSQQSEDETSSPMQPTPASTTLA